MTLSPFEYNIEALSDQELIQLYQKMVLPRMIEEKMLSLLRQGKISKWFSGIGQEAIAIGCASVLSPDEWIFPMHRNLGVFTTRGIPLSRLFAQWQGKPMGFTQGRDRSFHFGTKDYKIWGMISHLGPQLSVASGIALANKLAGKQEVTIAFTGEGGTSEGEFHEALNVASVWNLPVIFVIENNGYGLSTPVSEQYNCAHLSDRGIGYGMETYRLDGNNIIEVYSQMKRLTAEVRQSPRPILIEFETFRMRGHEEASGTKYVPQELMDYWGQRDPITHFENTLLDKKLLTQESIEQLKAENKKYINDELKVAYDAEEVSTDVTTEVNDIFDSRRAIEEPLPQEKKEMRFIDAISDAMQIAMTSDPNLVLMGQDIADYGGVFKITEGFVDLFGKDRVRNTPLCESAIIGIALGMSMQDYRAMVELQFGDFVTCGFNQIVNNLAKIKYRWNHAANVVLRMPCGGGVGAGPFHSQTNEAWFTHTPGLKVVYPSNPTDAKGLLLEAFADPNPVMYFEHKGLYRTQVEEVPEGYYTIPIGKGRYANQGDELSIITYGLGVQWATDEIEYNGISADIVDLRSLQPLDYGIISDSVKKTGRVLVLHEDSLFGGIGGEISAYISENLFEFLDAPIVRIASLDTPVPFNKSIEKIYLAKERLREGIEKLYNY